MFRHSWNVTIARRTSKIVDTTATFALVVHPYLRNPKLTFADVLNVHISLASIYLLLFLFLFFKYVHVFFNRRLTAYLAKPTNSSFGHSLEFYFIPRH